MSLAHRLALAPLAALALAACGDPVECIADSECPTGQYCVSTRCADPVPAGDVRTAYVEQVAVVIETGCNCHGPGTDRPWTYDHRFGDPQAFEESLRLLRQWLYDPFGGYPAAGGYGLATCGYVHPGIYADIEQPQYQLLAQWATMAYDELPASPPAEYPAPAAAPPPDTPLPDRERADLARIQAEGYEAVTRAIIVPRVIGHCGCCHALNGGRSWQIVNDRAPTPAEADSVAAAIERYVNRDDPDQSTLLRYGLGDFGRQQAHPVVFTGLDDPRYRLLRAWIAQGAPPPG